MCLSYYVDAEKALDLLFFKFGRVSEDSTNASSLSKAFTKNASMLVEILGGDPTAVSGNFSQWAPGVYVPASKRVQARLSSMMGIHHEFLSLFCGGRFLFLFQVSCTCANKRHLHKSG